MLPFAPNHYYSSLPRVAVILSVEEYDRLSQKGDFGKSLVAFRERLAIEQIDIDPDEVFKDVRDRSPGYEVLR